MTVAQRRAEYWTDIAALLHIGPRGLDELTYDELERACEIAQQARDKE